MKATILGSPPPFSRKSKMTASALARKFIAATTVGAQTRGVSEKVRLQIADVAIQNFGFLEAAIHTLHLFAFLGFAIRVGLLVLEIRQRGGAEHHTQMF